MDELQKAEQLWFDEWVALCLFDVTPSWATDKDS